MSIWTLEIEFQRIFFAVSAFEQFLFIEHKIKKFFACLLLEKKKVIYREQFFGSFLRGKGKDKKGYIVKLNVKFLLKICSSFKK